MHHTLDDSAHHLPAEHGHWPVADQVALGALIVSVLAAAGIVVSHILARV